MHNNASKSTVHFVPFPHTVHSIVAFGVLSPSVLGFRQTTISGFFDYNRTREAALPVPSVLHYHFTLPVSSPPPYILSE